MKLAQRVEQTLTSEVLYPEAKQIDPNQVLVSPLNRLGSSPNVKHIHYGILQSFVKDSFDRTRPMVGICLEVKSEEGIKKLLQHNERFSSGHKLLPPILATSGPVYAALAGNHYNLALRSIKNGTHSPIGNLSSLLDQPTLKEAALNGHRWWVLPETLEKNKQLDISLWRNQDQNSNQGTHDIEILQTIKHSAEAYLSQGRTQVSSGDLVSSAQKKNPAKISPTTWLTLAKYFIGFLENDLVALVDDLAEFHSEFVDPAEVKVSLSFLNLIAGEQAFKACPQLRHYLVTTQFCKDKLTASSSGPGVSNFLECAQILAFAKRTDQVKQVETTIRDLKAKYLPILEKCGLSTRNARLEITAYMDLIIRCLFNKPWPESDVPLKAPVGKFSEEKIKALGIHWAKKVDLSNPGIGFAEAAGLQETGEQPDEDSQMAVDLGNLRNLKRSVSGGPDPDNNQFKRGDAVTVIRRMSWLLPQKSNPSFRKDIVEGTEGSIEGWADPEMRQVLLKVNLKISGKVQACTQAVYPRNLKLTSDYLLSKAGEAAGSKGPSKKDEEEHEDLGKSLKWVLGTSKPADVTVEHKWKHLQSDDDLLTKNMYLRGRIAVGLQALSEVLPKYSEKDFVLVHRKNDKGNPKLEILTKRDFEPLEIMLAPYSSQVKDCNLMLSAHAVVNLPKTGRGAPPERNGLALDGRCRNVIANKGSTDPEEHTGSLYWAVTRTTDVKVANLDIEHITWQQEIKVNLPGGKKRKAQPIEWSSSELPSFPALVNKKAIPKHTKLCVFQAEKKKDLQPKKK